VRVLRIASLFSFLAVVAVADETVTVDLNVASPATPRFFSIPANQPFSIKLTTVVPSKTYQIVEENRAVKIPLVSNPTANCSKPDELAAFLTKDKQTEGDVATALQNASVPGCSSQQLAAAKAAAPSATFTDYQLEEGKILRRTIRRDTVEWKIVVSTQGTSAPPTPAAQTDATDRLRDVTDKHPSLIVMKCSYAAEKCATESVFVNADQVSTVYITDVPKGKTLTVRVGAGEYFPCEDVRYNFQTYASSPDTIIIPIHMWRSGFSLFERMASQQAEAGHRYGLDICPSTGKPIEDTAVSTVKKESDRAALVDVVRRLNSTKPSSLDPRWVRAQSIVTSAKTSGTSEIPPDPEIPLFVRGRSEVAVAQFDFGGGDIKTFIIPVRYQRFWLDAGGFFVFARHTDQSIDTETISGSSPEKKKVLAIHREASTDPSTGIVINIHPGNYPVLALQFGISANQGRLPSYYLGVGARAREIGKRGLATIAVGLAMQQEAQFPFVEKGQEYLSDSSRLQPKQKYRFTFPYLSISLGFSFGGVSEKTDIKSAVTSSN
jgi:hypothetical protein